MSPDEDLFETLSHPLRIEILKLLAKGPMRFAEIKRELRINSSGLLDFHLKKLDDLIGVDGEGRYVLNEKGVAALQAVEIISKYGWQKRAFFISLLIYILMNSYVFLTDIKLASIVLVTSTLWIVFYSYWTFFKRRVHLKSI
ncbi:MAG: helix-turn-helix transcriptional regulator [Candidatus Brockarchaeota archaeon]|nr:helix-turn-helix transcriptional regulator [Candidatus Brockarchaeota archaeon]